MALGSSFDTVLSQVFTRATKRQRLMPGRENDAEEEATLAVLATAQSTSTNGGGDDDCDDNDGDDEDLVKQAPSRRERPAITYDPVRNISYAREPQPLPDPPMKHQDGAAAAAATAARRLTAADERATEEDIGSSLSSLSGHTLASLSSSSSRSTNSLASALWALAAERHGPPRVGQTPQPPAEPANSPPPPAQFSPAPPAPHGATPTTQQQSRGSIQASLGGAGGGGTALLPSLTIAHQHSIRTQAELEATHDLIRNDSDPLAPIDNCPSDEWRQLLLRTGGSSGLSGLSGLVATAAPTAAQQHANTLMDVPLIPPAPTPTQSAPLVAVSPAPAASSASSPLASACGGGGGGGGDLGTMDSFSSPAGAAGLSLLSPPVEPPLSNANARARSSFPPPRPPPPHDPLNPQSVAARAQQLQLAAVQAAQAQQAATYSHQVSPMFFASRGLACLPPSAPRTTPRL